MAQSTGVRGLKSDRGRGRGRQHVVVAAVHIGAPGFRHMTIDAVTAWRAHFVERVGRCICHFFLMAAQAGAVGVLGCEPVARTGGATANAIELPGARASNKAPIQFPAAGGQSRRDLSPRPTTAGNSAGSAAGTQILCARSRRRIGCPCGYLGTDSWQASAFPRRGAPHLPSSSRASADRVDSGSGRSPGPKNC